MTDSVNWLALRETRREIEGAGVVIESAADARGKRGQLFHLLLSVSICVNRWLDPPAGGTDFNPRSSAATVCDFKAALREFLSGAALSDRHSHDLCHESFSKLTDFRMFCDYCRK